MTMLVEVGTYLDTQLATLTLGTNLFLGQLPDTPDTATVLYAGTAGPPEFVMNATDGVAHHPVFEPHRLQVVCRYTHSPTAYPDAETLAWSIYRKLSITNITLSSVRYLSIEPVAIPAPLEEDPQGRVSFVTNYTCLREPASATAQ